MKGAERRPLHTSTHFHSHFKSHFSQDLAGGHTDWPLVSVCVNLRLAVLASH